MSHNNNISSIFSLIDSDLKKFEHFWQMQLLSEVDLAQDISHYLMSNVGKRIRPALIFLMAHALTRCTPRHLIFATVVECFHNATLLHDDVIDVAVERRGKVSSNMRWSNSASILAGDYLYSHSLEFLGELRDPHIWQVFTRATTLTVEGELLQLAQQKFALTATSQRYESTIVHKTAHLFAVSGYLSAYLSEGLEAQREGARCYCLHLGILFQLIDDYLDFFGEAIGKTPGNDLKEGKATLPMLIAKEKMTSDQLTRFDNLFGNEQLTEADLTWARGLIAQYGGFDHLLDQAKEHAELACASLNTFPDTPYKKGLLLLPFELLDRKY